MNNFRRLSIFFGTLSIVPLSQSPALTAAIVTIIRTTATAAIVIWGTSITVETKFMTTATLRLVHYQ